MCSHWEHLTCLFCKLVKARTKRNMVSEVGHLTHASIRTNVTIQCDASQTGLGTVLLQNGQPVAYASRSLTKTEQRYAQIAKECLAIIFLCERFS